MLIFSVSANSFVLVTVIGCVRAEERPIPVSRDGRPLNNIQDKGKRIIDVENLVPFYIFVEIFMEH